MTALVGLHEGRNGRNKWEERGKSGRIEGICAEMAKTKGYSKVYMEN